MLYSLVMLLCATPMHTLMSEMEGGLGEAIQWVVGVASDDADTQCRALAQHVLSVFESTLKEVCCLHRCCLSIYIPLIVFTCRFRREDKVFLYSIHDPLSHYVYGFTHESH